MGFFIVPLQKGGIYGILMVSSGVVAALWEACMGTFYIKKNARGVRFLLRSETGRALTESADYATLDACKKGIASLIVNAPLAPVRDLTMGERGANPKFEITGGEGAFVFCLKSPNGKCVVTSAPFATRKDCLRAISMLRLGVADYEIVMERREEKIPLVIAAQMKQQAAVPAVKPAVPKPAATEEIITEETLRRIYGIDLQLLWVEELGRKACLVPGLRE
jgi:uncharacterized protein YegP (UPF0339 family)